MTCLYRNTSKVLAPKWYIYLDDECISLHSLQLTRYNDTVWQMVYDYSALCSREIVREHPTYTDQEGCGPQPDVFLNLAVAKLSMKCTVHGEGGHYSWNVCNSQHSNQTHMPMYRIVQHLHVDTIMYKDTDAGITTCDWTAPAITSRIMWNSRKWLSTLLAKNKCDRR